MGKLHETIAVEAGLKATAEKILFEAMNLFIKKQSHFDGQHRRYAAINDEGQTYNDEVKEVQETVKSKLDYVQGHVVRAFDCIYQKEVANTLAKANLIIDGVTILSNVPAIILLNLEKKFVEIRKMYLTIPTLDPGKSWEKDPTEDNIYTCPLKAEAQKTEKQIIPLVLAPATDRHPAQVEKINKDIVVGTWLTTYKSGSITPAEKSKLLAKIDKLIREIKKARMRANDQEVINDKIGQKLFDYING